MTVIIRPLQPEDQQQWKLLWDAYLASFKMFMPTVTTDTVWDRLLDAANPLQGLVAVGASGLIGMAHHLLHPVTWNVDESCFLMDLFVASEARCKGVGRQLLEAVCSAAESAGGGYVYWFSLGSNAKACEFYDKIARRDGYILYERHRNTN